MNVESVSPNETDVPAEMPELSVRVAFVPETVAVPGSDPELALTKASALRAYTSGAAYAAGMETELGALRKGRLCDITVVHDGHVVATVAGGSVTWRRKPA